MVLGYYFNFKCEKKDKTNSFFEMNDLKKPALAFGLESLNNPAPIQQELIPVFGRLTK